ncbi:unnamed protein product [Linum tenue]|uniref:RING-type E3 ubiquitin transferase n=2 Tax=Linum tenue TaxID=586396 RepID=A0AAV0KP63_9ROSI|nr:unnamed protein product [Linum tenue]
MTRFLALHRRLSDSDFSSPLPPPNNGTGGDPYISQTNFDANMVIILAALLCALIGALGLNSIVRCAFRCIRSLVQESPGLAATGLKKRDLRQIPVAVYGSDDAAIAVTECSICLGEFMDGEKVRVLPKCNHGFHVSCIDKWLLSRSSCPNCRHSLREPPKAGSDPRPAESDPQGNVAVVVEEGDRR